MILGDFSRLKTSREAFYYQLLIRAIHFMYLLLAPPLNLSADSWAFTHIFLISRSGVNAANFAAALTY